MLRNRFSFERRTRKVSAESLHYRIYQWWLDNTESQKTPYSGYQENLCHYMRVVLIWSPLLWFFVVPIFRYGKLDWLRPWMATVGLMVCAGIAYTVLFVPQLLQYLLVIGITFLVILLLSGVGVLLVTLIKSDASERFLAWFFTSHKFFVVYPWSVTLVTLVTISVVTQGADATWYLMLTIGLWVLGILATLLGALLFLGVVYAVVWLVKKGWDLLIPSRRRRNAVLSAYRRNSAIPPEKGISTVGLAARAVWAQHNRICPLLELPDTDNNASW